MIKNYEDIEAFKASCGVTSVMIARAAMWNCSIFRKEGKLPLNEVLKRFLEMVISQQKSYPKIQLSAYFTWFNCF